MERLQSPRKRNGEAGQCSSREELSSVSRGIEAEVQSYKLDPTVRIQEELQPKEPTTGLRDTGLQKNNYFQNLPTCTKCASVMPN